MTLDGVLIVDKPAGPTSHDIVDAVRRATGVRKVGHLGTLDPAATGVLPLVIGSAKKRARELAGDEKVYEFTLRLGAATDSDDDTGRVIACAPIPADARARIAAAIPAFVGAIPQRPPAFSAIRVGGRRAYHVARGGERPALEPRTVRIDAIEILGGEGAAIRMRVACRAGTYVRSLARDLGEAIGCPGHASEIRRMQSGSYTLKDAVTLQEIRENPTALGGRILVSAGR